MYYVFFFFSYMALSSPHNTACIAQHQHCDFYNAYYKWESTNMVLTRLNYLVLRR